MNHLSTNNFGLMILITLSINHSSDRLNGEDSKLSLVINSRRKQLLHFNVSGERGSQGKSLESSKW